MAWLGGRNCTSTRPHPDRSDTVGILPVVKPNLKASSPNIAARNMVSKKHSRLLRSPTGKMHSFVFFQRQFPQLLNISCTWFVVIKNEKSFLQTTWEKRSRRPKEHRPDCSQNKSLKAVWKRDKISQMKKHRNTPAHCYCSLTQLMERNQSVKAISQQSRTNILRYVCTAPSAATLV